MAHKLGFESLGIPAAFIVPVKNLKGWESHLSKLIGKKLRKAAALYSASSDWMINSLQQEINKIDKDIQEAETEVTRLRALQAFVNKPDEDDDAYEWD